MSDFYAYVHAKPDAIDASGIFYVGKGYKRRSRDLTSNRNKHHKHITEKYGKQSILIGLLQCSSEENALALEIGLIKTLRRMNVSLCNMTDGGEGLRGHITSAENRAKTSARFKGRTAPNKGMPSPLKGTRLTEEHKAKLSAAKLGKVSPRRGVKVSLETSAKIGVANFGRVWMNNGLIQVRSLPESVEGYLASGFVVGRFIQSHSV